jgi:hypothetical protein
MRWQRVQKAIRARGDQDVVRVALRLDGTV